MSWTDPVVYISAKLEIQWDGTNWIDESARLESANGKMSVPPIWKIFGSAERQQPWTATFKLANDSNRYSPLNSSSPIYSDIRYNRGYGIAVRFSLAYDNAGWQWTRIFTGYIDRMNILSTRNDVCQINAVDNSQPLLQLKKSTTVSADQTAYDWLTILASLGSVAVTDLDAGLFIIPYCWTDDENLWSEMCKTAHAEGGQLFFDADGTLQFRNLEAWVADTEYSVVQHTFQVSNFFDLQLPFEYGNVYNQVMVIASPKIEMSEETVGQLGKALTVLPGETKVVTVRHSYPARSPFTTIATVRDFGMNDISSDVVITPTNYAQQTEFSIVNSGDIAAVIYDLGVEAYPLYGSPVLESIFDAADADIGASPLKTLIVRNNEYVQTDDQTDFLGEMLRDRVKTGRNTFPISGPFIPTFWPGYLVKVVEAGSGANHDAFVRSISWDYSGGTADARYEMIEAEDWLLHQADYYELGVDTIADAKKAFY